MIRAPAMQKFLASMSGRDGCWIWPMYRNKDGYGLTQQDGKTTVATRVAYRLAFGDFDNSLFVLHRCDNPGCVNPDHLFLGTQRDNCADAKLKGRHSHGVKNGISKLTEEAVREIRESNLSQWTLARKFGVLQSTIWAAKHGKNWSHVK